MEYKRLLLLTKQRGRDMPPTERRAVISNIIALEKLIAGRLARQMLTGAFTLNLSRLPPRIRKLMQRMLNRRLHIIYSIERERKLNLKIAEDRNKKVEEVSILLFLKQPNNVGNLSPLQKLSDTSTENQEKHKSTLRGVDINNK